MISPLRRASHGRCTRSTTAAHCQAWKLNIFDTVNVELIQHLSPVDAIRLAATCVHLHSIHIQLFVSKDSIVDFSRLLHRSRMSEAFFKSVLSHATTEALTELNVNCCQNLTDESIMPIVGPSLTAINVGCRNLTNESILAIAANCPSLTALNVAENLTDDSITAIATNCPALTLFNAYRCDLLTSTAITAIAAN